jgi:hypothetical protein
MTLTQETLNLILSQIAHCGTTVADVVIMAMSQTDTRDGHPGGVHDVSLHIEDLLEKLHGHQLMHEKSICLGAYNNEGNVYSGNSIANST